MKSIARHGAAVLVLAIALSFASQAAAQGEAGTPVASGEAGTPAGSSSASEEIPAARLIYVPGRFVHQCPTEVEVQEGVTRRLGGKSPFAEPAERLIVLSLEGPGSTPSIAKTELFDEKFASLGARTIESDEGCRELVEAASLAMSIALAPSLALAAPAPAGEPPPVPTPDAEPLIPENAPGPTPAPVEEPQEPPVEQPARPGPMQQPYLSWMPDGSVFLVGVGATLSPVYGPGVFPGGHLSVAARVRSFELGFEQRQLLPLGVELRDEDSGFSLGNHLAGGSVNTIYGCGHLDLLTIKGDGDQGGVFGCGTFSFGNLWAIGGDFDGADGFYLGGGPYMGTGGRGGLVWRQSDYSALKLWTQVEWSIFRPALIAFGQAPRFVQRAPVTVAVGVTVELSWPD